MKALASISLVLLFLAPVLTKTGVWIWYETNKDDIAMEFCVNKDNPEMACNGQCHMKKTMQKVDIKLNVQQNGEQEAPKKDTLEDRSPFDIPQDLELAYTSKAQQRLLKTEFKALIYANPYQELECPPPEMSA